MELRQVLANELAKLMRRDETICILDADLAKPNGTMPLYQEFPDRCFDVGIAEANMASMAAGMSAYGMKPIIVTFTPFATRRICDQVAVSIAYARQNVKIIGTDPGITAELNGGTHMSFEDIGVMRSIPTMTIYDVVDEIQLAQAIPQIMTYPGPMYIRMPRKKRPIVFNGQYQFKLFRSDIVTEGSDITIIATGTMVYEAQLAVEILQKLGISAELISANTIKPLDEQTLLTSIKKTKCVVVCDNHNIKGGLYSAVCELVCNHYPVKVVAIGVQDVFGQVGQYDDLLKAYQMTKDDIVKAVKKTME